MKTNGRHAAREQLELAPGFFLRFHEPRETSEYLSVDVGEIRGTCTSYSLSPRPWCCSSGNSTRIFGMVDVAHNFITSGMRSAKEYVQGILREIKATLRKGWKKADGLIIGKLLIYRACDNEFFTFTSRWIFVDFESHKGSWFTTGEGKRFDKIFVAINFDL